MKIVKIIKKNKVWILLLFLCILFGIIYYNTKNIENFTADEYKSLKCNHYKFKSDEEYKKRTEEYNKDGYMKNKLSDNINIEWKKNANKNENTEIQYLINDLKKHMEMPLKKVNINNGNIHNISVVCMFRFEDDYLDEFLHYYIMHGITHFYLYSNKNKENTTNILQPYIDKGYITLIKWDSHPDEIKTSKWNDYGHGRSLQNLAFMDFNKKYKDQTKWIIKVDIDEFIYSDNKKYIKDILNNTNQKNINIPRVDFGSSNHIKKPNGLILENYTMSNNEYDSNKSICLTKYIDIVNDTGHAHYFTITE